MRTLFALAALLLFTQTAFAELIPEDIRIIRQEVSEIVKTENAALEKRLREYVDLKFEILDAKFTTKFEAVEKQFEAIDDQFKTAREGQKLILILVTSLIALIVLAIGIPQIIIAFKQRNQAALEAEIKTLREKVELLEQTRLVRHQ